MPSPRVAAASVDPQEKAYLEHLTQVADPACDEAVAEVVRLGQGAAVNEALKGWRTNGQAVPEGLPAKLHDFLESAHRLRAAHSVRTLTVTGLGLDFPHVVQAVKILRYRTEIRTGRVTRQTVYAITDMPAREASPQRIGRLARSQWGIEAVHHVRDTTFTEDASKIRTGHGPENMATLRNLAINTLRDAGHHSIAAGLREVSYTPFTRPLDLLGLY
ncbi:transposase [Streptomyces sp. NPDC002073]